MRRYEAGDGGLRDIAVEDGRHEKPDCMEQVAVDTDFTRARRQEGVDEEKAAERRGGQIRDG